MIYCKTCSTVMIENCEEIRESQRCVCCGENNFNVDISDLLSGDINFSVVPAPRPQQIEAAEAIAKHDDPVNPLLLEAEVGTGKTLAYLVAGIFAHNGVTVATSSKNLQRQICENEMPKLESVYRLITGKDLIWCVVQGRRNYVCPARLSTGFKRIKKEDRESIKAWQSQQAINCDAGVQNTHLFETMPGNTSSRYRDILEIDSCTGENCPKSGVCGYFQSNKKANSDTTSVVITNHHAVASWLKTSIRMGTRATKFRELIVIDEAHEFADNVRSATAIEISTSSIGWALTNYITEIEAIQRQGLDGGASDAVLMSLSSALDAASDIGRFSGRDTVVLNDGANSDTALAQVKEIVNAITIAKSYRSMVGARAKHLEDTEPDDQPENADEASDIEDPGRDILMDLRFIQTCLDKSDPLSLTNIVAIGSPRGRPTLMCYAVSATSAGIRLGYNHPEGIPIGPDHKWVMTSGTLLGVGADPASGLRYEYGNSLNISATRAVRIESPFNYREQMVCYRPSNPALNPKGRPDVYSKAVLKELNQLVPITNGFVLILATSNVSMEEYSRDLEWEGLVISQKEEGGAGQAIERYVQEAQAAYDENRPGPVLIGVRSLWRGVSLERHLLLHVIIPKMMFESPSEPIVAQRSKKDPEYFMKGSVPFAYTQMAQGVGRLIRTKEDIGIVSILDQRIHTTKYGMLIWNRLPCRVKYTHRLDLIKSAWKTMRTKVSW